MTTKDDHHAEMNKARIAQSLPDAYLKELLNAASILGAKGGKSKSDKKAAASRANGKLGGAGAWKKEKKQ